MSSKTKARGEPPRPSFFSFSFTVCWDLWANSDRWNTRYLPNKIKSANKSWWPPEWSAIPFWNISVHILSDKGYCRFGSVDISQRHWWYSIGIIDCNLFCRHIQLSCLTEVFKIPEVLFHGIWSNHPTVYVGYLLEWETRWWWPWTYRYPLV